MCESLEKCLSAIGLLNPIVKVFSLIGSYKSRKTAKRYASGNTQLVENVLIPEHLERIAEIINEASKYSDCPAAWACAAQDMKKYNELSSLLYSVERVCAIIHEDALPPKVKDTTHNQISNFLSIPKIHSFVEANQHTFPELWSFTKQ